MTLLQVFFILIVYGVALWAVNRYITMDDKIKRILNVVAVVAILIWLASLFFPGLLHGFADVRVGPA
jgi:exosortase/archaeosortase